ncbi:JmjC domain-containing protein [Derxia gummosa]|uniref:JmjC domain-containing protein n=1 Tax=Derxia gummosa DSM 723 TaxID=1121388 RepID=A0A9U5GGY2_9BURK|nr:cupin domain-containing protein [Derxia gummosa]
MQVHERLAAGIKIFALGIVNSITQGDDSVFGNLHGRTSRKSGCSKVAAIMSDTQKKPAAVAGGNTPSPAGLKKILGGMSVDKFLAEHWHREPLFIKGAVDPARLSIPPQEVLHLAADDRVESRLVQKRKDSWALGHGPFDSLPKAKRDWTVLVQGVNLHHPAADALLDDFRCLPHARLDDVMISYAVEGGGVGPHFDSYDVFLIQAHGTRRWRISAQRNLDLVPDLPLKILANFEHEQEFICEPGDLLYLPPRYAHDGVALDECMTWSVGFRAPALGELALAFLERCAEHSADLVNEERYSDPGLKRPRHPAAVPDGMVDAVEAELRRMKFDRARIADFLAECLSEPKPGVIFDAPPRPLSFVRFMQGIARQGLRLSPATLMLHTPREVSINGESFDATDSEGRWLRQFADRRHATADECVMLDENLAECLHDWYRAGWLLIGRSSS